MAPAAAEEKTEFDVVLTVVGDKKINVTDKLARSPALDFMAWDR
jgi:ribosomal protein L7/L12